MGDMRREEWQECWERVLEALKRSVSRAQYRTWLSKLEVEHWSPERVVLIDHVFRVDWLKRHFHAEIVRAVRQITGARTAIHLRSRTPSGAPADINDSSVIAKLDSSASVPCLDDAPPSTARDDESAGGESAGGESAGGESGQARPESADRPGRRTRRKTTTRGKRGSVRLPSPSGDGRTIRQTTRKPTRKSGTVRPGEQVEPPRGDLGGAHGSDDAYEAYEAPLIPLNPSFTFETFVEGPTNMLSCAAAKAVASRLGGAHNPLYLHGDVGLGKTHLLQAIAHEALDDDPELLVVMISCETFINQFITAIGQRDLERFRNVYRQVDLLLVDDVQDLAHKERTQEEFFHTFNALHQMGSQIVLASDVSPKRIPSLEERLISRFEWGLVTRIDPPELETRIAIVHRKARGLGLELAGNVALQIANHFVSNVRKLEGAINRLYTLATVQGIGPLISQEFARRALADLIPDASPSRPSVAIDDIVGAVVDRFGVTLDELRSRRRSRALTTPRHICMYLAQRLTTLSLRDIGQTLGGRDHSTVIYGVNGIKQRVQSDQELASIVAELEERLKVR